VLTWTAEQALDGAVVTVERLVAGGVTHSSEPVTIAVDEHGAAAPQVVSAEGATRYGEGDTVTLTAVVAPGTVLDRYRWYVKAAAADAAVPVPGATSAVYAFAATLALNGAEVSVAVTGEDGVAVYGPSAPVTLVVSARVPGAPDPAGDPNPSGGRSGRAEGALAVTGPGLNAWTAAAAAVMGLAGSAAWLLASRRRGTFPRSATR
jgi:hypothetical protein